MATDVGASVLSGASLKTALDCNWDDPDARLVALGQVLNALDAVEAYVAQQAVLVSPPAAEAAIVAAQAHVAVAQTIHDQDLEARADGQAQLGQGVARDRRISVEDAQMRHGRKSRHQRFDGYKRHVVHDLEHDLIRAVGLTPANAPEASVAPALLADLAHQAVQVGEWHLDRAYLASELVREREPDTAIFCKAWPVRNGPHFPKTAFGLDWARQVIRCPNDLELPFTLSGTVHFPAEACAACPQQARCTTSANGRSVSIHPDERLLDELRHRQLTPLGRAKLRERARVEHALAHVGHWQGPRARYYGQRKNLFDLRRCAVVHNLHVIARSPAPAPAA